jgi:nucleoside-diphosphate-sugar epimerase
VFSTGNVYPFVDAQSNGATEKTRVAPVGEYAQSTLARERIFEYFANRHGTEVLLFRLNYANDLRYGVLTDIGIKVFLRRPIDLTVGFANVIWQGDANSYCLRAFDLCSAPARALNVTGEKISVRATAQRFGELFQIEPVFEGQEGPTALLSDASICWRQLGPPSVGADEMVKMVAHWIKQGGVILDKPTKFERRDGSF